MEELQQTIANLETAIRGMAVPNQDRIWWRFRQELPLLQQLLAFDLTLVRTSEQVYQYVAGLIPEGWQQGQSAGLLRQLLQQLTQAVRDRERLLLLPM